MRIILSTYSFYPLQSGGTEVYTLELSSYLMQQGHQVLILASSNKVELESLGIETTILDSSDYLDLFSYFHGEIKILGVEIKNQTISDQYFKYNIYWVTSFRKALQKIDWYKIDSLYMQGISGVSGPALIEALRKENSNLPISCWVHTPFMCIKGNLLTQGFNECNSTLKPKICGSCLISDKLNRSNSLGNLIYNGLEILQPLLKKRSMPFNLPSLINLHFDCFEMLKSEINQWICFSDQLKEVLINLGVDNKKIIVNSHGIDTQVFNTKGRNEKKGNEPILFLFNGRWEKVKGIETLMKAWMLLDDETFIRKLVLLTKISNDEKQRYDSFFKRKDIVVIEPINKKNIADYYKKIDCVIIPSEWIETGPLVFHEAIACGCFVIASNIGGNKYLKELYTENSELYEVKNYKELNRLIKSFTIIDFKFYSKEVKSIEDHFKIILNKIGI